MSIGKCDTHGIIEITQNGKGIFCPKCLIK